MVLQVVDTAAPIRGGVDTAWKTAKLETGLELMVPLFISKGEMIRVDTQERKYAGKSNKYTFLASSSPDRSSRRISAE